MNVTGKCPCDSCACWPNSLAEARLALYGEVGLMSSIEALLNFKPGSVGNVPVTVCTSVRTKSLYIRRPENSALVLRVKRINKAFETKVNYQLN